MTQHISSEKARAGWREILDRVAAGEQIVIERYGRPVAVIAPYRENAVVREPAPAYDIDREQLKTEIVADLLRELGSDESNRKSWREELDELRAMIAAHGGLDVPDDTEALVEYMRRIREEIFEAEYAHLYR